MSACGPLPKQTGSLQVYTLEVDRRPTLAFEALDLAAAQDICRDADLRTDLIALTSNGISICAPNSELVPRLAVQEEVAVFRHAIGQAPASDMPTMTFLIKIDGVMVVTVGPEI